jgi:hypothetical protein
MREEGNQRVDCGTPIKSDFPAVVSEELFFQVQAGTKARFRVMGRPGEFETNLFTGIVRCAETPTTMSVHTFRQASTAGGETRPYRYLTSGATARGTARRGMGLSCPYPPFEQWVLQTLSELTADVLGAEEEGDGREAEIADLTGKWLVLDHRIPDAEQKASDPEEESPEVYDGLRKTLHKSWVVRHDHLRGTLRSRKMSSGIISLRPTSLVVVPVPVLVEREYPAARSTREPHEITSDRWRAVPCG